MRMPRPEAPAAFARAILLAYAACGRDPSAALAAAGLTLGAVEEPADWVGIEAFEALSAQAMRELDDEALGWFSRRLRWGSYGMILRASLPSPTLDVALRRWCRHHGLLTEDIRLAPRIEDGACAVRIEETADLGALREFCLVTVLRTLRGVSSWLIDSRIPLIETRFPFPPPPHAEAYAGLFRGTVVFGAEAAEMRFDAGYARLPVVRDDAELRRLLAAPISLIARQYRQDRLLSQRIIREFSTGAGLPSDAPDIAARLNVSLRSLQRHLREEGTSLGALRAGARRARAEELLRRSDLPIKRVARMVGYGDEASFGRAFRSWTGQTPARFRRASEPS